MPLTHAFVFPLANGLHARPASHLAEVAGRFAATATLVNTRTGRSATLRSVLGLVATDTRAGDACRLEVSGADEAEATKALREFLDGVFLRCDEPVAAEPAAPSEVRVPRSLCAAGLDEYHVGNIACRGLAEGVAVLAGGFAPPAWLETERATDAKAEGLSFDRAREAASIDLHGEISRLRGGAEAAVLSAHLAILNDPAFLESVASGIGSGLTAGQAVGRAVDEHRRVLLAAENSYIRERVLDLEDIATRLWQNLYGAHLAAPPPALSEPSVVLAESLTPSQFLALDRRNLRGLVLARGGQTSHAVILARSFGIPTLTGVPNAPALARAGGDAIVDANLGIVILRPPAGVRRFYAREAAKLARIAAGFAALRGKPAATADGRRLEVAANVASVEEAVAAFALGAEGIGLFRTELVFADRATAPTEDEQYAVYAAVAKAGAGRPVIIRMLDVGGDKPVPFLSFPAETNPFLGYRAVRFYQEHAPLVKTQLRALLRAAAHGPVRILVPMIASIEEARVVRGLLNEARAELAASGEPAPPAVPLGFMLEVPSVAFILDELCAEAEFFSLGTNDLAQYFFAADRENAKVAPLNDPLQPAFLRLLRQVVERVRAQGRWIGLCGELAENAAALPLLAGLGLDEISLAAPRIAATKAALARLDAGRCEAFLRLVMAGATREDVRAALACPPVEPAPLLAAELVLDLDAASKTEAIRALVDELHVAGRTSDPAAVEEAVWRREETYSTGFGDGFALPHCQTDALDANTIAVARLRTPVDWNAMDGKPVDLVILLGVRASEHGKAHMQTLARLSRLMMRDEFRAALRAEATPAGVVNLLGQANGSAGAKT